MVQKPTDKRTQITNCCQKTTDCYHKKGILVQKTQKQGYSKTKNCHFFVKKCHFFRKKIREPPFWDYKWVKKDRFR